MTRTYQLPQNTLYQLAGGRAIGVAGDDAQLEVVGPVYPDGRTLHLGPLTIEPHKNSTVGLDSLRFPLQRDNGSLDAVWPLAASAGLIGSARHVDGDDIEAADEPVSRRDVLKMGAAVAGIAAVGGQAQADEDPLLNVAKLDPFQNDGGFKISIADIVADVLNVTQEYTVTVGGARMDTFHADGGHAVVPPDATGEVSIHAEEHKSRLAWIQGQWTEFTHEHEFELDKPASEYEAGDSIVLTDSAVVVDPLRDHGGNDAIMEITNTSIPHRDESSEPVGQYYVNQSGELVYAPGEDAPETTKVLVKIDVGMSEQIDDAKRATAVRL